MLLDKLLLRLVFFLYTSLENSVGFGHGRLVRSLASVVSALSKEKILRLFILVARLASAFERDLKF